MRSAPLLVLLLCLLAAPVAGAAPARPAIVVQKSILDVRLGDTEAEVVARLGQPRRRSTETNEEFGTTVRLRYRKLAIWLNGDGTEPGVFSITDRRRRDRTAENVGVGSSITFLRAHVDRVKCFGAFCYVGRPLPGRKRTLFLLNERNRVKEVSLSRPLPGT